MAALLAKAQFEQRSVIPQHWVVAKALKMRASMTLRESLAKSHVCLGLAWEKFSIMFCFAYGGHLVEEMRDENSLQSLGYEISQLLFKMLLFNLEL